MGTGGRWLLAWALLTVLAVACTPAPGDDGDAGAPVQAPDPSAVPSEDPEPVEGGTVVVAVPHEPDTLHPLRADPDAGAHALIRPVLSPLWRVLPDGTSEPWLLADEPEVRQATATEPFTVVYRIRDDAVWSDGEPIEGDDLLFTLEACRRDAPRDDCAGVDLTRSSAEGREAVVVFEQPVGNWRAILQALPVLPEHVLRGRATRSAWTRAIDVSSGPFAFASWTPGERLVLERNERWWGPRPALDRIEFRFDDAAGVDDVVHGVADVAQMPASPAAVDQARADRRVRGVVSGSGRWAVLDFNLATVPLDRRGVRRGLAAALDRATVVDELVRPVQAGAEVGDTMPGFPDGADEAAGPALSLPTHAVDDARRELDAAGCAPGEAGVRTCGDRALELTLATPAGSWQAPVVAEYVRSQLRAVGARVNIVEGAGGDGSGGQGGVPSPPPGDGGWDARIVALDGADAATQGRWRCDGPGNDQAFCDTRYDELVDGAATAADADQRAELLAQAALLLSQELPTYPLYEMPTLVVHARGIRGVVPNPGPWGLTWNVDEWARTAD
ncbi:MAG TPA: ABC transporter substrate-binding protein [Euzebyales bacterium]|nr:ABC transporter substrate-binding protein [Euzebyales bacterium]